MCDCKCNQQNRWSEPSEYEKLAQKTSTEYANAVWAVDYPTGPANM